MKTGRVIFFGGLLGLTGVVVWLTTLSGPSGTATAVDGTSSLSGNSSGASAARSNIDATPMDPSRAKSSAFAGLGVLERKAILDEIRRQELGVIFDLMLKVGREERDLTKQLGVQSALIAELQLREPDVQFYRRLTQFILDDSQAGPDRHWERILTLKVLGGAGTKESAEFLIEMLPSLAGQEFRRAALDSIAGHGALRGDGVFHEEIFPPLGRAWNQATDQDLLQSVAKAMAELGAPQGIELLLSASLGENGIDRDRQRYAKQALSKIYTPNAVPPLAARLSIADPASAASQTAASILAKIGDSNAANSLINWLRAADRSAALLVPNLVLRSATPLMLGAWQAALQPAVTFRAEVNREAIRSGLQEYQNLRKSGL